MSSSSAKNKLAENCQTVCSLVWGHCTEYTRTNIEAVTSYDAIKGLVDLIALLKTIKGLIYQYEGQKYNPMAQFQSQKHFFNLHQSRDMTNVVFLERFMTIWRHHPLEQGLNQG
jgi:hypothetical protein